MEPVFEKIVEDVFFGKSLFWDIFTQSLYFVDYVSRTINRYVPETQLHFRATLETSSSFLIPVEDRGNKFVISNRTQIAIVSWDGLKGTVDAISKIVDLDELKNCNMLRTGKCDEWGRLWTGLLIMENYNPLRSIGRLYSYRVGTIKTYFDGEVVSGIAWNKSNSKMFYINSSKKRVDAFDFDIINGDISNRQVLFTFENHQLDGMPYGMTSDEDDNLWIAIISASKVIKISTTKPETLLYTLNIPTEQPVSLAWGGENLDELYISTSSFPNQSITMTRLLDGSLYRVTGLNTKGIPMHTFSLVCLP
ncbi:hypothetical protein WA026_003551 [Henosepilachna vigintioctopunctata]|uniref:SMP-30/Gluconolactonase/LRE-like region domain-containing protein n=1 Tax=Henosepilachna vigintioctopunctata TaxID=420089 RepID=A0AAW1TP54_9CUCU